MILFNYALKLFRLLGCESSKDYMTLKDHIESSVVFHIEQWQELHGLIDEYGKKFLKGDIQCSLWNGFLIDKK